MRTLRPLLLPLALAALAACNEDRLCPADQLLCGDACVAVASDAANCGACGNACDAGNTCSEGVCRCGAGDGRVECGGACVDLESDPAHCGACDAACPGATLCTTGGSGVTSCEDACALPAQTACGRACVVLADDPWNCGACDRACGTNERCEAGACVADLYVACFNSDEVREATRDLEPAGLPLAVAPGPMAFAALGDTLYVASSRWTGIETLSAIRRDPPAVRVDVLSELTSPTQDIQALAARDGLLYVSHTSVGTLLVLAPDGAVVDEQPLLPADAPPDAKAPNPAGIAFAGDDVYVALNERNEVVVLDVSGMAACARGEASPPCMTEVARIDLQPLASEGALARPSGLLTAGGRVYAALWNLDATWNPPAGSSGRLAAIDAAARALDPAVVTGGVAGLVDLGAGCLNPADLALHEGTLWVTCGAFDFSGPEVAIAGGGVVPVDLSGSTPVPGAAIPAGPGEAPGNLAFCGGTGYVGDRNSGQVFRLDPSAGLVDGTVLCPAVDSFAYVTDLACGF